TPYSAFNLISMAAGALASWLLIARAPFPAPIRILLPFTYYLFFQYAVIARSYSLLPVLTFACAVLYANRDRTNPARAPLLFTLSACLLAAVSLDGYILAAVIYGNFLLDKRREPDASEPKNAATIFACSGLVVLALFLLAWAAWPAVDNQFV